MQIPIEDAQGNKAREPEQHGECIDGEDDKDVGDGGCEARGKGEEEDG